VPSLFAKIDAFTLRRELKLEYAQGDSLEVENDWLVWGGKPNLGKQVVFNNPLSQCMRCHKIGDRGGIAGPSLDGIADRMTQEQLLESLINPNANVADGFGEYSAMPPMGTMLNHRELRDVAAFLKTLLSDQK
jgi:mono/diheme cytochrome c family protein